MVVSRLNEVSVCLSVCALLMSVYEPLCHMDEVSDKSAPAMLMDKDHIKKVCGCDFINMTTLWKQVWRYLSASINDSHDTLALCRFCEMSATRNPTVGEVLQWPHNTVFVSSSFGVSDIQAGVVLGMKGIWHTHTKPDHHSAVFRLCRSGYLVENFAKICEHLCEEIHIHFWQCVADWGDNTVYADVSLIPK